MLTGSAMGLIPFLVKLIIACLILYGVYVFLNYLPLPQPIRTLVLVIIAIIGLVFLMGLLGVPV